MRKFLGLVFLVFLLLLLVSGAPAGNSKSQMEMTSFPLPQMSKSNPPGIAEFDSTILAIMAQGSRLPGCAISFFCTTGIYYTGTYGYAVYPDSIPITENSLFGTLSVSKAVTGTVLMDVWDSIGFNLDGEVSNYVDFSVIHPTCPDSVITPRTVMTHRSGMPHEPWGSAPGMPLCPTLADILDPAGSLYNPAHWEDYCPVEGYHYGATGPCLAACMVEYLSGQPFSEYSRANIFEPLGMSGSGWSWDGVDSTLVARSYHWWPSTQEWVEPVEGPVDFRYPAVGFRTSIHDLARFTMAMMHRGELDGVRVMEPATVDTMFTRQWPRLPDSMGLTWFYYNWPSGSFWAHLGGGDNYTAAMIIHESMQYGLVLLINGGNSLIYDIFYEAIPFMAGNVGHCLLSPVPDLLPSVSHLEAHPNPFNPRTTITFSLESHQKVELSVFDLSGRRLAVLADRYFEAGTHSVDWQGRDQQGRAVASGTYLVRMISDTGEESEKITLIR